MIVFKSEEQARAGSEQVPSMLPDDVTLESNEVRGVVARA